MVIVVTASAVGAGSSLASLVARLAQSPSSFRAAEPPSPRAIELGEEEYTTVVPAEEPMVWPQPEETPQEVPASPEREVVPA